MATQIKKGQSVTLSTTEVAYELVGDHQWPITTVMIVLVSGTVSATVAPASAAPILDGTYTSYSTAGDKILLDMETGISTLRMLCASAGVVTVTF